MNTTTPAPSLRAVVEAIRAREDARHSLIERTAAEVDRYGSRLAIEQHDEARADVNADRADELADLLDAAARTLDALHDMGALLGDPQTAADTCEAFNCGEADAIARALALGGEREAARVWLEGHALGDDHGDEHTDKQGRARDLSAYVDHL